MKLKKGTALGIGFLFLSGCGIWGEDVEEKSVQWEKAYELKEANVYSIQQTSDEGYVGAGVKKTPTPDSVSGKKSADVWIFKLDPNGSLKWSRSYGGHGEDYAVDVHQTKNGGYMVLYNSPRF